MVVGFGSIRTLSEEKFNLYDLDSFKSDLQKKYFSLFDSTLILSEVDQDGNYYVHIDKIVFDYFYESLVSLHIYNTKVKDIFMPTNMYALHYWIVGEVFKKIKTLGRKRSLLVYEDGDGFYINNSALYSFIGLLIDKLKQRGINIKKAGFPKYSKNFTMGNYGGLFVLSINKLYKNKKLKEGILRYSGTSKAVLNQEMAIKMAKKMSCKEVYDFVKSYGGSDFLNYFSNADKMEKSGLKLYERCKISMINKRIRQMTYNFNNLEDQLKKERISLKSCITYIKYLALAGIIQKRVGRPIELTASIEKKWFRNGYRIMSDACQSLNWVKCTDQTFCKGVRSRTYAIRVCFDKKWKFSSAGVYLNNIERAYSSIKDDDVRAFVSMKFGIAGPYLHARSETYNDYINYKKISNENFHTFNNGFISNKERFAKINRNKYNKKVLESRIYKFKQDFSSTKKYRKNNGVKYFELNA